MKLSLFDKIEKNKDLKNYIEKTTENITDHSIFALLPQDFITDQGTTSKQVYYDLNKVKNCSTYHERATYKTINKDTGKINFTDKTIETNYCNIPLLCSVCSKKLTSMRLSKYMPEIEKMVDKYKYYYLVTKTIDNVRSFDKAYNKLNEAERAFQRIGQKGRGGEFAKVKASIGKFEVKIGKKSGTWHIHSHTIFFTDEMLDYRIYDANKKNEIIRHINKTENREPTKEELHPAVLKWMEYADLDTKEKKHISVSKLALEWFNSVGDGKSINIDVSPIKKANSKSKKYNDSDIKNECLETLKYMSKTSNMPDWAIIEMLSYRAGKRFFRTTGDLRGIKQEDEQEELGELDSVHGHYWDYDKKEYVDSVNKHNDLYLKYKIEMKDARSEAYRDVCLVLAEVKIEKTKLKKLIIDAKLTKKKTGDNKELLGIVNRFDEIREATGKRIGQIIKVKYKDRVLREYQAGQPVEYNNMYRLLHEAQHRKRKPTIAK